MFFRSPAPADRTQCDFGDLKSSVRPDKVSTGLMDVRNRAARLLPKSPRLELDKGTRTGGRDPQRALPTQKEVWPEWEMFNNTDQGLAQYSSRRRFPRFEVNRPVTAILYWDGSPPVQISGRCHSLSEGGLGATMSQQLRVGEVVNLEVANGVRVYAAVRNLNGFAHGFEFVLVRDNQRAAILRLCRARMS